MNLQSKITFLKKNIISLIIFTVFILIISLIIYNTGKAEREILMAYDKITMETVKLNKKVQNAMSIMMIEFQIIKWRELHNEFEEILYEISIENGMVDFDEFTSYIKKNTDVKTTRKIIKKDEDYGEVINKFFNTIRQRTKLLTLLNK